MVYEFAIAGDPVPQGSMRHVGGGRLIHSKKLLDWRRKVASRVREVTNAKLDQAVIVDVLFSMAKPKSTNRDLPTVAPDLDKLQRAIGDAMSVDCDFLKDDALIVEWQARKIYGIPGVFIRVITVYNE
jgi:Holliday junction resolvase RusA-like endonuclease